MPGVLNLADFRWTSPAVRKPGRIGVTPPWGGITLRVRPGDVRQASQVDVRLEHADEGEAKGVPEPVEASQVVGLQSAGVTDQQDVTGLEQYDARLRAGRRAAACGLVNL
ncbi:hypothetical protein [Streptomyces sp. NPDC021356]|uniref:hypothetical protein n=1 Tax=Streptomyces sp. NPDC021356 TaxID=3154900 RepID=UPI0033C6CFB0